VNQSKWQCDHLPAPTLPAVQSMPTQEAGTRMAPPLPYVFNVTDNVVGPDSASGSAGNITLTMDNNGAAGAAFIVFNRMAATAQPRKYTIEAGKSLDDVWSAGALAGGKYNLSLHGPNGYVRQASGDVSATAPVSVLGYDAAANNVVVGVSLPSDASGSCSFTVTDNAYNLGGPWTLSAAPGAAPATQTVDLTSSASWYDLTVEMTASSSCPGTFVRRFMGHMETGKVSTTDPAMAVPTVDTEDHPLVPEAYRTPEKYTIAKDCATRRSRMKDHCWGFGSEKEMLERHGAEL